MNPDTPRGADIAPLVPPRRRFGELGFYSWSLYLSHFAVKSQCSFSTHTTDITEYTDNTEGGLMTPTSIRFRVPGVSVFVRGL
jgi:hypothetical protein